MNKTYAGIGSRETPIDNLVMMVTFAIGLSSKGYTLRSGGAKGADKKFESGCDVVKGKKEIFYAKDATEEAMTHASYFHPAWLKCDDYTRALHGRNSMIILGKALDEPVDFVVCWTPGGRLEGGTAQGLRIAIGENIKIYNLFNETDIQDLKIFIEEQ